MWRRTGSGAWDRPAPAYHSGGVGKRGNAGNAGSAARTRPTRVRRRVRRWARRGVLLLVLLAGALALGHGQLIDLLGGHTERRALQGPHTLSPAARAFLEECLGDLEGELLDVHTHLVGQGNGSDCWVNPRMRSLLHPVDWGRYRTYLSAAGMGVDDPDSAYVEGLAALAEARPRPARHLLLAFDHRYQTDGTRDLERSEFYVPNEYAFEVAAARPERFACAVSIHPYRADAVGELERWAARGVRVVKWLPAAQGIDPADPRCDPFYGVMAREGMALLTHAGRELAVHASEDQELGNPLRLRRPLAAGVTVLAAHCASTGRGEDLDHPGQRATNFELFLRLMDEPQWRGRLFGEISTVTQVNRYRNVLATLLERGDLHPRLVNGSDWPLPAVNVLYQTRALWRDGFLTGSQRRLLNELYHYNPMSFDLCLKRAVAAPGSGARFAPEVFGMRPELGLRWD